MKKYFFVQIFFYELEFVATIDWTGFGGSVVSTWMFQRVCLTFFPKLQQKLVDLAYSTDLLSFWAVRGQHQNLPLWIS